MIIMCGEQEWIREKTAVPCLQLLNRQSFGTTEETYEKCWRGCDL
jgi:hypothetical protein